MTVSSPMSAPTMRPVLPRTNSAASGLRFCGMMDEPVEKASESFTKPNCGVVQRTISSAKRERCVAQIAAALKTSSTKSRSATLSSELAGGRSKPSALAVASRAFIEPGAGVAQPAAVAAQHLDVGHQVMTEGHGLRGLQMGEARHRH